jgi:tripartite-type tricarboxylate transporter receptor subunit TctC
MTVALNKLIISAEAGSTFEKVGQVAGEGLQRAIGHDIVFESAGDSSGVGGAEAGARAPIDGSTILICNKGAITSHPHRAKTYKASDFAPLCQVAEAPIAVAVGRNSPHNDLRELFEAARKAPETIRYSTPNAYHTQRLAMEDFSERTGIKFKFLILPGGNPATIKQLNEDTVDFAFLAAQNFAAPARGGDIKVLGVAHGSRLPFLASVPTFGERGYDLVTAIWLGLFAPNGVGAAPLSELCKIASTAIQDPRTTSAIEGLMLVPSFLDQATFSKKVKGDSAFHLNILQRLGAA